MLRLAKVLKPLRGCFLKKNYLCHIKFWVLLDDFLLSWLKALEIKKLKTCMHEDIVLTPMMKQFLDLKAKHPDAVMLFSLW